MHKKLEAELISLAHQILQMKNKDDVARLRDKAREVYEKLSVLTFVDNYFVTTPNITDSKENFLAQLDSTSNKSETTVKEPVVEKPVVEDTKVVSTPPKETIQTESNELETNELVEKTVDTIKTEASNIVNKIQGQIPEKSANDSVNERKSLEEEMKDSIPVDVAANMFEKANRLEKQLEANKNTPPKVEEITTSKIVETPIETIKPKVNIAIKKAEPIAPKPIAKASLNDRISNQKLQIGLNDRIAFVKHLFNFSQEDFNRVLSQLNSFNTEQECVDFLNNTVKPDYEWNGKEEYEERLLGLIERKFK